MSSSRMPSHLNMGWEPPIPTNPWMQTVVYPPHYRPHYTPTIYDQWSTNRMTPHNTYQYNYALNQSMSATIGSQQLSQTMQYMDTNTFQTWNQLNGMQSQISPQFGPYFQQNYTENVFFNQMNGQNLTNVPSIQYFGNNKSLNVTYYDSSKNKPQNKLTPNWSQKLKSNQKRDRKTKEQFPPLIPLAKWLDPLYDCDLNKMLHQIYNDKRMDENDERMKTEIVSDLQQFLHKELPEVRLCLFGSTKNGFGARNSDLDISLSFVDNPTGKGFNSNDVIKIIGVLLKSHPKLKNVLPIVNANIPIVELEYIYGENNCFDCDISLYNVLAIHNTRMLKTYTLIDKRVAVLGFIVKHFAKTCDMCDSSRGSLSSYAYILMTIHYLQQKKIIPVLQEIGLEKKTKRIVKGWDTWYFDDLENLYKYWTPSQNTESVAQLFVGFLRYYTEIFNFDEYVICCRRFQPLKRVHKMWRSEIAIEDPFILFRNLGSRANQSMARFIRTAFLKARNLFGVPPNQKLDQDNWSGYYFNRNRLTTGLPPTPRSCRLCGKVGHRQQKVCPLRLNQLNELKDGIRKTDHKIDEPIERPNHMNQKPKT